MAKKIKNPKKIDKKDKGKYWYGTGRRKEAVAQVRIQLGSGEITINDKKPEKYFDLSNIHKIIQIPYTLTGNQKKFNTSIILKGGGKRGQIDAIKLGLSLALLRYNQNLRTTLRKAGLLTRDSREKERKKYGLKGARRAPQWQKR